MSRRTTVYGIVQTLADINHKKENRILRQIRDSGSLVRKSGECHVAFEIPIKEYPAEKFPAIIYQAGHRWHAHR